MKNTRFLIAFCLLFFFGQGFSQSSFYGKLPWVKGDYPQHIQERIVKIETFDSNLEDASKKAKDKLVASILAEKGVNVSSTEILTSKSRTSIKNSLEEGSASSAYISTIKIKGEAFIKFTNIDEYYEYKNGMYHLWVLYLVAEDGKPLGKIPSLAYKVDKGAWRSFLFPGWAQLYQGRTGKGLFFIASEVTLIGAGVYFNNQYKNNNQHFLEATSAKIKQEYRDRANKKRTYSYVAFGTAGAMYIYNIIDALTSKKGKVSYDYSASRFTFYPTTQYNYANNSTDVMATVCIKF